MTNSAFLTLLVVVGFFVPTLCSAGFETESDDPELKTRLLCEAILEETERFSGISEDFLAASRLFSHDPASRGLWLRSKYGDKVVAYNLEPAHSVAQTRRRGSRRVIEIPNRLVVVQYKRSYPRLRVAPLEASNSMLYFDSRDVAANEQTYSVQIPNRDRTQFSEISVAGSVFQPYVPPVAVEGRANRRLHIVDWKAGYTGLYSQSGRVLEQLKRQNEFDICGIIPEEIRRPECNNWFPISAVASDESFHGAGDSRRKYFSLDAVMARQEKYYDYLNHFGLGVSVGTRSGANLNIAQRNYLYSLRGQATNPIKSMIWMAPMHPIFGYNQTLESYFNKTILGRAEVNPIAFEWFSEMRTEIMRADPAWFKSEFPLGDPPTPLLILVGELDGQVPPAARRYFKGLAEKFPNHVYYVEIPGADHDVFAVTESFRGQRRSRTPDAEKRAAIAWSYVYWFLRSKVLNEPAILPEYNLIHVRR